jgi:hypothetical protein
MMLLYKSKVFVFLICAYLATSLFQFSFAADDVTVNGNRLEKNGQEWIPMGFTFDAFVAPIETLNGCKQCDSLMKDKMNQVDSARKKFGVDSINKAKVLGSNVIRLQISQPGLDPKAKIFSNAYKADLENAIRTIRNTGQIVMLSMTHGEWSGLEKQGGFPNDSTFRAWSTLKDSIIGDKGIILEIYNEPNGPKGWKKWQQSHQELISQLRNELHFKNVIIVNGLKAGRLYNEAPSLFDPLNQLAYGVHPYLGGVSRNDNEQDWIKKWAWLKNTKPLIVTEWNALGKWPVCNKNVGKDADKLINFLMQNKLGMIGWAYDIEGSIFNEKGEPTDFDKISCGGNSNNGGGKLILKALSVSH